MNEAKQITPEQKWKNADLSKNFIFYKVMRDHPNACQHLLEILENYQSVPVIIQVL